MRGSLLVTFDEVINDRGIDRYNVTVNNQGRYRQFTDCNNLYSTYIETGDQVSVSIQFDFNIDIIPQISVIRRDFTTDDEGGDRGIKETPIIPTIFNSQNTYSVLFTGTTRPDAYDFYYIVSATTTSCPTECCWQNVDTNPWGTGFNTITEISFFDDDSLFIGSAQPSTFNGVSQGQIGTRIPQCGGFTGITALTPHCSIPSVGVGFSLQMKSQSTGKYVYRNGKGVSRINSDFSEDLSFNTISVPGGNDSIITGMYINNSDEIYILGRILSGVTECTGTTYTFNSGIYKLTPDGSVDTSYTGITIEGVNVSLDREPFVSTENDPNGKALFFGFTGFTGDTSWSPIMRLNSDGTPDSTFDNSAFSAYTGNNSVINGVFCQQDGKYMVFGGFTNIGGLSNQDYVVRLNSDGTLDTTFSYPYVNAVEVRDLEQDQYGIYHAILVTGGNTEYVRFSIYGVFLERRTITGIASCIGINGCSLYIGGSSSLSVTSSGNTFTNLLKYNLYDALKMCVPIPNPTPTPTSSMPLTPTATPTLTLTSSSTPTPTPTLTVSATLTSTPTLTPTPTTSCPPIPTPEPIVITSGYTLYYDANNNGSYNGCGNIWHDLSVNNYDGTLVNSPIYSGGTPEYFSFNGVDNYVSIPYSAYTFGYTFGGWIKFESSSNEQTYFCRGMDDGSLAGWGAKLTKNSSNQLVFSIVHNIFTRPNTYFVKSTTTSASFINNQWYYVLCIYSKSFNDNTISISVNPIGGGSSFTFNAAVSNIRLGNAGWLIGRGPTSTTYSDIEVAEFQIYDRILNASERQANFDNTKSKYGY